MPTLTSRNNKAKRDKQKRGGKGASGLKSKSKKREEQVAAIVEDAAEELAEEVYTPDTPETEERVVPPRQEIERATPFSDGIVAASLADLVMVPHASGSEVELTRGFLRYFAATGTYIGSMSSKLSFMKKKGGTLL